MNHDSCRHVQLKTNLEKVPFLSQNPSHRGFFAPALFTKVFLSPDVLAIFTISMLTMCLLLRDSFTGSLRGASTANAGGAFRAKHPFP